MGREARIERHMQQTGASRLQALRFVDACDFAKKRAEDKRRAHVRAVFQRPEWIIEPPAPPPPASRWARFWNWFYKPVNP